MKPKGERKKRRRIGKEDAKLYFIENSWKFTKLTGKCLKNQRKSM